jgi:1,4-dihydroxy-2-naphthoate octaprenyltransferase
MGQLSGYLGVARAPFLVLPVTLAMSGGAASAVDGPFDVVRWLLALLGLTSLHVAVNVLNEWSDMRTGIDLATRRTPFSGGSGTLPERRLGSGQALAFGILAAVIGLAIGLWFVRIVGGVMLPFLILGGILVIGYTDVLARTAFGEIAAGLGLGALPVSGFCLVQSGSVGATTLWASVPAFFMTFNLLLLNEFPDQEADRAGGRRNLVLLLGPRRAAWVYAVAALATPASIVLGVALEGLPAWALLGALPSVALVKPLAWAFGDVSKPVPLPALGANVVWNLATNALLGTGLLIAFLLR